MTGLPVFFVAMFLLNITPGPEMLYVLARLLRTVPAAYTALRPGGAAYLIYFGVRTLLARGPGDKSAAVVPASPKRIFVQGVLANVLNPKVALAASFPRTRRRAARGRCAAKPDWRRSICRSGSSAGRP